MKIKSLMPFRQKGRQKVILFFLFKCLFRNVPVWALPHEIRTMAHAISGRRFDGEFAEWFLPQYSRERGRQNPATLVFSAAEFLI